MSEQSSRSSFCESQDSVLTEEALQSCHKMTLKDELIWKEAAERMYGAVLGIEQGEWFDSFNSIQLYNLYLTASILYYRQNISIMSDHKFDLLCRYLLLRYDIIKEKLWNKELFSKERLSAGTGYDIKKYPAAIYCISQHYIRIKPNEGVL